MKKLLLLITLPLFLNSCYNRLGDLTQMSNKNIDSAQKYQLLARNVETKVKSKKKDCLERAIDKLVEKYKGDYLMNVTIYVSANGEKIKIKGDVWGIPTASQPNPTK